MVEIFIPAGRERDGGGNKKRASTEVEALLAAGEGFEPSHTESESAVLPLHNPAMFVCEHSYYTRLKINVNRKSAEIEKISADVGSLFPKIGQEQLLKQLVPVDAADERPGVVIVGDVGGILREDITYDLVDGVVALLHEGVVHTGQDLPDFGAVIQNLEFACGFFHGHIPP